MAKQIDSIDIKIKVKKDSDGEVIGELSSKVILQASEYPNMDSVRQAGNAPITLTLKTLATSLAKQYLEDSLVSENAEDNIPIPPKIVVLTIDVNGTGTVLPLVGTHNYLEGVSVNILAESNTDWEFDNWTGDVSTVTDVTSANTSINMDEDYSITANFIEPES